jgi:hypothetical protein
MRNFLRDCSFIGPALPEPFVQFELETELVKLGLLPVTTGSQGRELQSLWEGYRRKLRELVSGGPRRVRNHVIEPLLTMLGYEGVSDADEVQTREGPEDAGVVLVASEGSSVRLWCTEYSEDLDAPTHRGAAYRFSHLQVARRVLKAKQERVGLLTNGVEFRIIILDLARTDSEIIIRIDPAWKDKRANELLDSFLLFLTLCSPKGVRAVPDLVDKARLQQARVTKELRRQAREAVEGFLQEVLDHPENQSKLGDIEARHKLAPELWREALIVVYRLLFILKLESTDDPARSFKFSTSTLWRNTFSPTTALPRFVRKLLDEGAPSGNLIEQSFRKLFQMFVDGLDCSELHVRPLGGSLFGTEATPLLSYLRWGERGVALLLDRLLWTSPKGNAGGRERVHYGSLDVEDLGRVYEALLELEPGIATEGMCRLRRRKLEVVVPIAQGENYLPKEEPANSAQEMNEEDLENDAEEVPEEESDEPARGRGTKVEWVERIPVGQFYLRVGLGRKATGSYYTPQSFVRYLVQQTLEPLVVARSPKEDPRPAEILKIKVLDPAMGSGHFLVEACRFLGGKLYEAARLCDERLAQALRTVQTAQNDEIRAQAVREAADYGQRLAAFLPPEGKLPGYLPSRAPEAGESSGISQKQAEAICRRLVAIHCLYGVDKNPLGVELAKVALWLESHSEGFPLTFLDHRLVLGDSITGPFFDHLLNYPGRKQPMDDLLTQGLREKFTTALNDAISLVQDIESTLCSTMPDFEAKTKLRKQMEEKLAPFKVVAAAWAGGVMLAEGCDDIAYAELLRTLAESGSLPTVFATEGLRKMIARGMGISRVSDLSAEVLKQLESALCVLCLAPELAFPEVFLRGTGDRGFDVVLGNPPWEGIRRSDNQFFGLIDFEALAGATKREKKEVQMRILANETHKLAYAAYVDSFQQLDRAAGVLYQVHKARVNGELAGRGTYDWYMLFAERAQQLVNHQGFVGWVLPSAFHSNEGATGVRRLYLQEMCLKCCYSFENRRQLFEIHRSFKFALIVAGEQGPTKEVSCAFFLRDDEWLSPDYPKQQQLSYSSDFIARTGGEYLLFLELRGPEAKEVATQCYGRGTAFADVCDEKGIQVSQELNMTYDAGSFTPALSLQGLHGDPRDPANSEMLLKGGFVVLHEGKTFHQYTDVWQEPPRYLVDLRELADRPEILSALPYYRAGIREVSSGTNERTLIAALLPPATPSGHTVTRERSPQRRPNCTILSLIARLNSYPTDWCVRLSSASHVTKFVLNMVPIPNGPDRFFAHTALRLTCNHSGFEPLWREQLGAEWRERTQSSTYPVLGREDDRWDLRAAIDAVVAEGYGLGREQYKHVLASFSHKSFPQAPEMCLSKFDELRTIGLEPFTRKYDPYWDIPLNEKLPEPIIKIPISASRNETQHTLDFNSERPTRRATTAGHADGGDELTQKLRDLLVRNGQISNADAQSALGCSAAEARAKLKRLVDEHFARVEGRGRSTRYVVVPSS